MSDDRLPCFCRHVELDPKPAYLARAPSVAGAGVLTDEGQVETYHAGVASEVAQLRDAVTKYITDKWGPEGFAGPVMADRLAERRQDYQTWVAYFPIGKTETLRTAAFLPQWDAFETRNFKDGKVKKWTSGSLGDYALLGDLYDAVAAYRVRNNAWQKTLEAESGKAAPVVKAVPDAKDVDKEVDDSKPKGTVDKIGEAAKAASGGLAGLVPWIVGGLGVAVLGAIVVGRK